MNLSNVASILADSGMSLSEKGIASGKVILTGFVVVFAVLLLLIMIIKLYSTIVQKAQQSGKKKKEKRFLVLLSIFLLHYITQL